MSLANVPTLNLIAMFIMVLPIIMGAGFGAYCMGTSIRDDMQARSAALAERLANPYVVEHSYAPTSVKGASMATLVRRFPTREARSAYVASLGHRRSLRLKLDTGKGCYQLEASLGMWDHLSAAA